MKHYFNSSIKTILAFLALGLCASCTEDWDNHYSVDPSVVPEQSILQMLISNSETSNFVKVLQTTKTYNGKKMVDAVSYYDLLGADQFLTVWAPVNSAMSAEEWAVYTKAGKTEEENYLVSQRFLKNHIARFNHPVGKPGDNVTMMSTKRYRMEKDRIQHSSYIKSNQACSNGILHTVDKAIDYTPNLYEYLTTDPQYKDNLGAFLASYTKYEIDEEKSVPAGIVDGKMKYVDTVLIETSILLDKFGYINREDSNYNVILPNGEAWVRELSMVLPRFNYGTVEGADSLGWFWANSSLLTDAFFNMNASSQPYSTTSLDSTILVSTTYDRQREMETGKMFHTYFYPFDRHYSELIDESTELVECSNGNLYLCDKWPFDPSYTYDAPIVREAELGKGRFENTDVTSTSTETIRRIQYMSDVIWPSDISESKILIIKGKNSITDKWQVKFDIYDNLSGYYNIYLVIAPNCINGAVYPPKPNMFTAEVDYYDANGEFQTAFIPNARQKPVTLQNDVTKMDTLLIAPNVNLSACNLAQSADGRVQVVIDCTITTNKISTNSNTMLLDCIYLEPVTAPEDAE